MPNLSLLIKPVSGACNLRCRYCFYLDESAHRQTACFGTMSETTLQTLVRRAFAYADGPVSFAFQGGEPLLAGKAFYRRVLALQKQYNTRRLPVTNALQTNGTLLDEEWAELFAEGQFSGGHLFGRPCVPARPLPCRYCRCCHPRARPAGSRDFEKTRCAV